MNYIFLDEVKHLKIIVSERVKKSDRRVKFGRECKNI